MERINFLTVTGNHVVVNLEIKDRDGKVLSNQTWPRPTWDDAKKRSDIIKSAEEVFMCRLVIDEKELPRLRTGFEEIAETLHSLFCHWNHTDGCGWHYGDWDNLPIDDTRKKYLATAQKFATHANNYGMTVIDCITLLTTLKGL